MRTTTKLGTATLGSALLLTLGAGMAQAATAADGNTMATLRPVALNGVDASGTAMVTVNGTRIAVTMAASGLLADSPQVKRSLAWSIAAIVSLPMIVAAYRKASALGMLLAELSIPERIGGAYNMHIRSVLARFIPLATMWVLGLLVAALASTILPPREVALVLVLVLLLLAWLLWRGLVQVHARLQAALRDTLDKSGRSDDGHG